MTGTSIAEAWLAHAEGRSDDAVRIMRAAADLDDATEKHPVTPGAILPAREQFAARRCLSLLSRISHRWAHAQELLSAAI